MAFSPIFFQLKKSISYTRWNIRSNVLVNIILITVASCGFQSFAFASPRFVHRVVNQAEPGTGFILRVGSSLFFVTAKHVLGDVSETARVQLQDGRTLSFPAIRQLSINDIDLAIVPISEAEAGGDYSLPAERPPSLGDSLVVWGYPVNQTSIDTELHNRPGKYIGVPPISNDGYQLLYSSQTQVGFSGGPILNDEGHVVGVHGRSESTITAAGVQERTGRALGIPISELLRRLTHSSSSIKTNKINLAEVQRENGRIALKKVVEFLSSASMSDQVLVEIAKAESVNLPKYCTELAKAFYYTFYSTLPDLSRAKDALTITSAKKDVPYAYYILASIVHKKSGTFTQGLSYDRLAENTGGRIVLQYSERQVKQSVLDEISHCSNVSRYQMPLRTVPSATAAS